MSSDEETLQDAINRALKAANRALKKKQFEKVADIYYRIASMLNDLGDEAGAQNFSNAAKKFKEKNEIIEQIQLALQIADGAYGLGDFKTVAENYFNIASLSELIGDKTTAERFRTEAKKFAASVKGQRQPTKSGITTMKELVPAIQSQIPSTVKLTENQKQTATKQSLNFDDAMMALGLVCPHCGADFGIDLEICPKCGKAI